jgi:peptide/nickel transport system ATP-binding protein
MPRDKAEADAVELYRRMRLPNPEEIGFRYPHQVSGGQLQRAMTAMAMACRPDLIIFDEPTTALDVTTQIEVLAAIRDIVRAIRYGGHLHHARPCRRRPDGRPHQGAPARR